MKYAWVAVLTLCVMASGAWAQSGLLTARSLGMGGASIAIADDAAAWLQNPAGLACLNVPAKEGNRWGSDAMATYLRFDPTAQGTVPAPEWEASAGTWSAWQPEKTWGIGAGVAYVPNEGTSYGAGIGNNLGQGAWSWGVNFLTSLPQVGASETLTNLGLLYRAPRFRLGVVGEDVLGRTQDGPLWNAGFAAPLSRTISLAVDVVDVTGKTLDGARFSGGIEWSFLSCRNLVLRGGLIDTSQASSSDHELTVGAGYKFNRCRVDVGWANIEDGMWSVSSGFNF